MRGTSPTAVQPYLLFVQREMTQESRGRMRGRLRILLMRVERTQVSVLMEGRIAPAARVRLAVGERTLYALSRNRVLRIPIVRTD